MKALKKGKEYTRVEPLPDEWFGPKETARKAETKNLYQQSFKKLKKLLDDGWEFCAREPMRKYEKEKAGIGSPRGHKGKAGVKGKKPNKKFEKKNERKQKTRT